MAPTPRRLTAGSNGATDQQIIDAVNLLVAYIQAGIVPAWTVTGLLTAGSITVGTGPLLLPNGALALPLSFAFTNDTNSGARWVSADDWTLVAGASDVLVILKDTNGVAVGVAITPQVPFHVSANRASDHVSRIEQVNASAGAKGLGVISGNATAGDPALEVTTNNVRRFSVMSDGKITGKGDETIQKTSEFTVVANDLTLVGATPTSFSPACSLSLAVGEWMVQGVFSFTEIGAGDVGQFVRGRLTIVSGSATIHNTAASALGTFTALGQVVMVARSWAVTVTATAMVEIQAWKDGGGGTSVGAKDFTTIEAWYMGPV